MWDSKFFLSQWSIPFICKYYIVHSVNSIETRWNKTRKRNRRIKIEEPASCTLTLFTRSRQKKTPISIQHRYECVYFWRCLFFFHFIVRFDCAQFVRRFWFALSSRFKRNFWQKSQADNYVQLMNSLIVVRLRLWGFLFLIRQFGINRLKTKTNLTNEKFRLICFIWF